MCRRSASRREARKLAQDRGPLQVFWVCRGGGRSPGYAYPKGPEPCKGGARRKARCRYSARGLGIPPRQPQRPRMGRGPVPPLHRLAFRHRQRSQPRGRSRVHRPPYRPGRHGKPRNRPPRSRAGRTAPAPRRLLIAAVAATLRPQLISTPIAWNSARLRYRDLSTGSGLAAFSRPCGPRAASEAQIWPRNPLFMRTLHYKCFVVSGLREQVKGTSR